jgi:hypothetical protein
MHGCPQLPLRRHGVNRKEGTSHAETCFRCDHRAGTGSAAGF